VKNDYYKDIISALQKIEGSEDRDTIRKVTKVWRHEYQHRQTAIGKRVFIIGNGGSCAIAEHISTDLNKRCNMKALTLSNNSLHTALTNDYGQENALVEWMKINHFNKGDYLVAISSSGKSKNILNALEHAHDCLGSTLSIFGMDGENPFTEKVFEHDYIHIDNYNYGVIELTSEIILHGIVESLVVE
jgi:phosphoheptose isomerase